MAARREVVIPVRYKGVKVELGYRADIVVEEKVLLELKAVEALLPLHQAQLITYLKHSGLRVGLLINFHAPRLVAGIRRFVN